MPENDSEDRAYVARLFAGRSRDAADDEPQPDPTQGNRVPREGHGNDAHLNADDEREFVREFFQQ